MRPLQSSLPGAAWQQHSIMIKQILFWTVFIFAMQGCQTQDKPKDIPQGNETDTVKQVVRQTGSSDSALLLKLLDSLPAIKFPYHSEFHNRNFPKTDLSEFSDKKLTQVRFQKIPTIIGGSGFDNPEDDSTFDLADKTYKAEWNLIARRPGFFVAEVHEDGVFLVTLTYDLTPVDAIRIAMADPLGNRHWHAYRHSDISKELTINIHHAFEEVDEAGEVEVEKSSQRWKIDESGHFRQVSGR
jgi:hypothetical protein